MSTALFLVGWLLTRLVLISDTPLETSALLAVAALQVTVSFVAFGLTPVSAGVALVALLLLAATNAGSRAGCWHRASVAPSS